MRGYLASLSPWRAALLQGLVFVAWMTGWDAAEFHDGLVPALVGAMVGAVVVVPFTWYRWHREEVKTTWVVGQLSAEQRRAVVAAAATGEPPADPALRPAAVALARYRLQQNVEYRTFTLITLSVVGVLLVIGVVFDRSVWNVLGVIAVAALLVWTVRYPMIQRRRIATLEAACVVPIRSW